MSGLIIFLTFRSQFFPIAKAIIAHFSVNGCTPVVASAGDYHSLMPSRKPTVSSPSLASPSPHGGILGKRDGRRFLSVVSFSSRMSHPAASFALFVAPTKHHEAKHTHSQSAHCAHNPCADAVYQQHSLHLSESLTSSWGWLGLHATWHTQTPTNTPTNLLQHKQHTDTISAAPYWALWRSWEWGSP